MDWQIQHRVHALKVPVTASHGTARSRLLLILRITDGENVGWGEAAPIDGYSETSFDLCEQALRDTLPGLSACDPDDPDSTLRSLDFPLPSNARAALECALRDLSSRRAGRSLLDELGGPAVDSVRLRALLPGTDPADLRDAAGDAAEAGFESFKIKLGSNSDQNLRSAMAVRGAVGPDGHISADPNAIWTETDAADQIAQLAGIVDLIEQPVAGVNPVRKLRNKLVPIALDEAATNHEALDAPAAADAICLKVQAFGGIDRTIEAATHARKAGMQVLLGSTLEGAVGMAASLVAAQIIDPDLASGLSTLDLFEDQFEALPTGMPSGAAPQGVGLATDPDGTPC